MSAGHLVVLVMVGLMLGCSSSPEPTSSPDDAQIDRVEARLSRHEADISRVEQQAQSLGRQWASVVAHYERATSSYRKAQAEFDRAVRASDEASATYQHASESWQRAKIKWDIAQKMIEFAARIDARNLAQFRAKGGRTLERDFDCSRVSTRSWRRELERDGVDLTGLDVDHIVPRSKGGADHPLNYQLLDSSTNRSLGATWNMEKCATAGAIECAGAMAVSSVCGSFSG